MPHRFGIALLILGAGCLAEEANGPAILRPTDQSVLPAQPLTVVARTAGKGELQLDGAKVSVTEPAPNVLMYTLAPKPGRHELTLLSGGAGQKVQFFVKNTANASQAPEGWAVFKPHPPAAQCDTCHAVKEGAWVFKSDVLATVCSACHDQKQFPAIHQHNTETLAECGMCHMPHGSTAKSLLKMKKELACKQCHG